MAGISDAGYNIPRLRQFTDGSKHRLDLLRRVDDAARHARIRHPIRSRGCDDVLGKKPFYHLLRFNPFHIEADHAGGKIFIARCIELDTGHVRKALFHLTVEPVYPRSNSRRADILVKANCLR